MKYEYTQVKVSDYELAGSINQMATKERGRWEYVNAFAIGEFAHDFVILFRREAV